MPACITRTARSRPTRAGCGHRRGVKHIEHVLHVTNKIDSNTPKSNTSTALRSQQRRVQYTSLTKAYVYSSSTKSGRLQHSITSNTSISPQLMRSARFLTAAAAAACAAAQISAINVWSSTSSALAAGAVLLQYNFTAADTYNLTRGVLFPYISFESASSGFVQFGSELGPLQQVANDVAAGQGWLQLPASWPSTTLYIALAAHTIPEQFSTGLPPPASAVFSNVLHFSFTARAPADVRLRRPQRSANSTVIAMEFEPWFTPLNWQYYGGTGLAEAISVFGRYSSVDALTSATQAFLLAAAGMDSVMIDWTNNLWSTPSWDARGADIQQLTNATAFAAGLWSSLAAQEGWSGLPSFLFLLGLDNGPVTPMPALLEELAVIADAYVSNSTAGGYSRITRLPCRDGWSASECQQPLVVIFDGSGADHQNFSYPNTTIRWMASQNQGTGAALKGYWSWMDGTNAPPVTVNPHNGMLEAATATPAWFASAGWLASAGHQGGLTLAATVEAIYAQSLAKQASTELPLPFLSICQYNEYAGQANGQGYGPSHSIYVDAYSSDLTNDLEATSPFACGYNRPERSCGGGGWTAFNQLSMLVDGIRDINALSRDAANSVPGALMIAVLQPVPGNFSNYTDAGSSTIQVSWELRRFNGTSLRSGGPWLQPVALPITLAVDGVAAATVPAGTTTATLNVTQLDRRYPHELTITAQPSSTGGSDHLTQYPLSFYFYDFEAPLAPGDAIPATATAWIRLPETV